MPQQQVDYTFDSNDYYSGTKDNPKFIFNPPLRNVVGWSIQWINIPYTYFTIDRLNNQFSLVVALAEATPLTVNINIRSGTYTAVTLATAIQTDCRKALAAVSFPFDQYINVVYNTATARFAIYFTQFDSEEDGEMSFAINITSISLAPILGALPGVTYNSTVDNYYMDGVPVADGISVCYAELPLTANLQAAPIINLHSSLSGYGGTGSTYPADNSDIIMTVPITSNYTSNLFFQPIGHQRIIDRNIVDEAEFYCTLQGRDLYAYIDPLTGIDTGATVPYLPFNGPGFQICIRFFIDDGTHYIVDSVNDAPLISQSAVAVNGITTIGTR